MRIKILMINSRNIIYSLQTHTYTHTNSNTHIFFSPADAPIKSMGSVFVGCKEEQKNRLKPSQDIYKTFLK